MSSAQERGMREFQIFWKYIGEELALFWINPWHGNGEKIATFWWPAHPIDSTDECEKLFEGIASRACNEPSYRELAEKLAVALADQPQIVYETLLACTAWMGIPEKKREDFITERSLNIKFIVDKHLSAYRAAVGK